MKKISLFFLAGIILMACDPNQKEAETKKKTKQDSIHVTDSIKNEYQVLIEQRAQDSLSDIQETQDSMARARVITDSLKNAKKGGKKK